MRHLTQYHIFESAKNLSPDQIKFLNEQVKGIWTINKSTGLVDVDGDFSMPTHHSDGLNFNGIKFGKVYGDFDCQFNGLVTLEGAPKEVGGSFDCSHNDLTTLGGAPQKVGGGFYCGNNNLTTLEGAPQKVGGDFYCGNNNLTTLEGAPKEVGGRFDCSHNTLTSLKGVPEHIGFSFISSEFSIDWHIDEWINLLKEGGKHAELIVDVIPENELDAFFKQNPMDLDLLDDFPEIKTGVIRRTGIRDLSKIAALKRIGMF